MPEPKTEATAAAGDYRPEIAPVFTYDGATITWRNTPAADRAKFAQTIGGYAETLKSTYRVRADVLDPDGNLELRLDFKAASTATGRQRMKGDVFMIIGDTIWRGGGS